jgi:predicted Fe-Mo cluster-binding NifX family protein
MKEKIRFAFALNADNEFGNNHFGDADKYVLVTWDGERMQDEAEVSNAFKTYDEQQEHGSRAKGKMISQMLLEYGTHVLVSRQFGPNIRVVSRHFIPVVIHADAPAQVKEVLEKNVNWIADELQKTSGYYKLFMIKNGILKTQAKEVE